MSDRKIVIDMQTRINKYDEEDRVRLFMDGESGTWRLFVGPRGNSDFSLATLLEFGDKLAAVLEQIERDPDGFNAEVRKTWQDAE